MFTVGIISVRTQYMNPLYVEEREFKAVNALIYESLVALDDDYMPQGCLAESWERSNDAKTWTFHLRSGITFHNGKPLTANDVKATAEEILRLAELGEGQFATLQYIVKSVKANDGLTFTVTTSRPYYGLLYAMTFPVLPADEVQYSNPSGTGPYALEGFSPGDYIYLSANRNWWKAPPKISQINVVLYAANKDLINAYEYNRIDAAVTRSASASQYSRSATSLTVNYRTMQLETLMINRSSFPLNSEVVRRALRYAVNPDLLQTNAYQGMADRTDTPIPQGTWMYHGNDAAYEYSPEKARRLLEDDGWFDMDGDGELNKVIDGKVRNLHVQLYVYEEQDNSVRVEAATMIASMLEAVGFGVKVSTMTFQDAADRLKSGNYDLCLAAFQMDPVPDPGFMLMRNNTGNYSRYSSQQMDKLFSEFRSSADFASFRGKLYEIQDLFAQDCPFVCLYYRTGTIMTRKMFTTARDIREPDLFRGIETYGY